MDRQEYPAMVATLEPSQAINVLNDRVRQVGRLNSDIADWLLERRKLEEQYSNGLRKLAKRSPPGENINDLGIFSVPWNTLTSALETLADSHHVLAQRIEVDVERPLREFASSNREMQAMSTIQGNLSSMARDIENAQRKTERLNQKGSSSKAANAGSELENAQTQWASQSPYVFENLQSLDETRLNHLRDVLTQFQTHEVDAIEKNRVTAEKCLNILLNVETADEIKTFALRVTSGDMQPREKPRSRQSMFIPPSLAPPSHADDAASMRSASASTDRPTEPEKKQSSGVKGLKRLGTVLGRRRESKMLTRQGSESPERKSSRPSAFNSLSSRFGRNHDLPTPLEEIDEPTGRPHSPLRNVTSHSTNGHQEQPVIDGSAQSLAAAGLLPETTEQNNVTQLQEPLQPSAPISSRPVTATEPIRDAEGYSEPPPAADLISQAQQEALEGNEAGLQQFKLDIRQAPIAEEGSEDALTSIANTLKMQAPPISARRAGTVRGRREMRASVYDPSSVSTPEPLSDDIIPSIAPPPQTRELPSPELAPAPVITSPQSPRSPTFASPAMGSSTFSPYHGSAAAVAANIFRPGSRLGDDVDTGSIRSGRSLGSTTSQSNKHPELHEPGLNTSVIETVSAWFEHGHLTRSVTIGEVALAYNPVDFSSPFGTETIRLDKFTSLEKVAPNPAFLTQITERPGEYTVNLGGIAKSAVAFKYQLSSSAIVPGTNAPLLLTPAWKVEATQTSAILSYTLNPAFTIPAGVSSITLTNVVLILHLDPTSPRPTTCLSKPVGVFDKNKGIMYWQLGNVTLTPGAVPSKLLARFATAEQAKPGHIEARWEIVGEGSVGGSGLGVEVRDENTHGSADPFADEEAGAAAAAWKKVSEVRKVVSGTYSAQ